MTVPTQGTGLKRIGGGLIVPAIIIAAGERAGKRFVEFFAATIRNGSTRKA
jgi:hypothetical protein